MVPSHPRCNFKTSHVTCTPEFPEYLLLIFIVVFVTAAVVVLKLPHRIRCTHPCRKLKCFMVLCLGELRLISACEIIYSLFSIRK